MPAVSPACCLCINIHHYAPPRIVLQAATGRCAGHCATRTAPAVYIFIFIYHKVAIKKKKKEKKMINKKTQYKLN